jgi:Na+/H+ antiporter NhaD/arsenite permease-like protein
MSNPETHLLTSTTDPVSQGIVAVVLVALFVLLTLEKAHRVLVALAAASLLWLITYLTPWRLVTFEGSVRHLDLNVLLLLAGMMALVGVLRSTGVFEWMVERLLTQAGPRPARVLGIVIWFTGISSALADNVTTVIFVTPIALGTARTLGIRPVAILLPMIMAANIGGTGTLVGDPPNIMIGSGASLNFVDFLVHLAAPALVMLVLLQMASVRVFRKALTADPATIVRGGKEDPGRAVLSDPSLLNGLLLISAVVLVGFLTHGITGMPAAVPAVVGAAAALVLQDMRYLRVHQPTHEEREHGILRILEHEIEWPTLAFFTFLFIIVGAAVDTGLVERVAVLLSDTIQSLRTDWGLSTSATLIMASILVLWAAGILSALIDNIPFVAVSIPIIHNLLPSLDGNTQVLWWALALGACLGGNGTPVGASANVTTLGLAERAGSVVTFRTFLGFGMPVMIGSLLVSTAWLVGFVLLGRDLVLGITLGSAALFGVVAWLRPGAAAKAEATAAGMPARG